MGTTQLPKSSNYACAHKMPHLGVEAEPDHTQWIISNITSEIATIWVFSFIPIFHLFKYLHTLPFEGEFGDNNQYSSLATNIKFYHSECARRQQHYALSLARFNEESQSILTDIQNPQVSGSFNDSNMTDATANGWEYIDTSSQEDGDFVHVMHEVMECHSHIHRDHHTWRQRVRHVDMNWTPLYPTLMQAFLKFHFPSEQSSAIVNPTLSLHNFLLDSINICMLEASVNVPCTEDIASPVEALVIIGYLSPMPTSLTIAISISTLELYHLLCLHKPSFSIEAYMKLMAMLQLPLAMTHQIDEPELKYSCMLAFDMN
ncbi:hypothetical protein EDD16DRAFT_1515226 [Pisolithus croceorrhizus]|nr:hypothetical protein EDD16DRAFT_1515226 [Pisolithus croceorrhizus]